MRPWIRKIIIVIVLLAGIALVLMLGTRTGRALVASMEAFVPLPSDSRVYYEPDAREQAEEIARLLPAAVAQVGRMQLRSFAGPVRVFVCATQERFNTHVPSGQVARGATFLGKVFLSPRAFATQSHKAILIHELSHLHWRQQLGPLGYVYVLPAWFQEGLAVYVSDGGGAESVDPAAARRAIIAGRTFTPEDTGTLLIPKTARAHGLSHHMFYRQSALFISYLHNRDASAFQDFLAALYTGQSFKEAFTRLGGSVSSLWAEFVRELDAGQTRGDGFPVP